VLGRDRISLMGHGVRMVGGKEKRMMTRMVAACDLDLLVKQAGNEVGLAVVAVAVVVVVVERKIERWMSDLASYRNHRHLC
jgi:hypothetical protein